MADQPKVSVLLTLVDKLSEPMKGIRGQLASFGTGIKALGATIAATFTAAAMGVFLKSSVKNALEAEDSITVLDASLRKLGTSYKNVAPEVEKYLTTLQRTTKFSAEDGRNALANLITVTGDYRKSMDLLSLSADLAAKRHISMADAATIVGKASIGVTRGLQDLGIVTTDGNKAIDQMRATLGGLAEVEGATVGGRLSSLNNLWEEFKERIGAAIIRSTSMQGALTKLQESLVGAAEWVDKNSEAIGGFVEGIVKVGSAIGKVAGLAIKGWGLIYKESVFASTQTTAVIAANETKQTAVVTNEGKKRTVQTKQDLTDQKEAKAKAERDLADLQKLANKSAMELLSAHERAYLEIETQFREKMKSLKGAQYAEAEALLKKTHDNQLLLWAGLSNAIMARVEPAYKDLAGQMQVTAGVTTDFNAVLQKHGQHLSEADKKAMAAAVSWAKFKDEAAKVAFTIADGADALRGFLDVLGLSDEKMDQLVAGVGDLAEGIGKIASGDIVGGILQGIGGIKNAIGGLFGKSEAEKKLEEALNKNRNRLEELSRNIGDLNINLTGKQLSGTQDALKEFAAAGGALSKGWGDRLGAALLKRGLTMTDLDEVAKTLQIELRPNGHLDPRALAQLQQALGLIEPTQFANDFRGQRDSLRHEAELFNLTPEQQAAKLASLAGGKLGSSAIGGALGGLDFSTAEGRQAGVSAIQGLFTGMPSMTTAQLGGLTSAEFLDVLEEIKGLLESANDTASNTPSGSQDDPIIVTPEDGEAGGVVAGPNWSETLIAVNTASRDSLAELVLIAKGWSPSQPTTGGNLLASAGTVVNINGDINVTTTASTAAGSAEDMVEALNVALASRLNLDRLSTGRVGTS